MLRLSVSFWSAAAALPLSDCRTFPRIASGITDAGYNGRAGLVAGILDHGRSAANGAADTAATKEPGAYADAKKRLAGEGAAVHSATQN